MTAMSLKILELFQICIISNKDKCITCLSPLVINNI